MSTQLPAGTYYIGDLCYVVNPHKEWIRLLERTDYLDGEFTYRKQKCYADGTAYGDGRYTDNLGNQYPVDAGLIGIMPVSVIKNVTEKRMKESGNIFTFENEFEVSSSDGIFDFGHIHIDTKNDDEDEEDNDYL